MKLSQDTINILQNFQSINPSIIIDEGNCLRTIATTESIFAKANIPDSFPRKFGIYDLSKFLGILSLSKESELEFLDNHILIKQGRSKIKYSYCSTNLIMAPPNKEIVLPSKDVVFELKSEVLKGVMKAMSILGFSEIAISGEDGVLSLQTLSVKNDSSDVFSTELGETDKTFSVIIEADKLKMITDDYTVTVTEAGLAYFKGNIAEYWIAISTKSRFE